MKTVPLVLLLIVIFLLAFTAGNLIGGRSQESPSVRATLTSAAGEYHAQATLWADFRATEAGKPTPTATGGQ